ncbi:hypothetical protein BC941DRAFT_455430 [Chlamydoabsidia padenii]|nr:hypothetical protein BC941DRAFT_455430 [Chlamydoabsidia padenii]
MLSDSHIDATNTQFASKKSLRLILDEPVLFVQDKPAMIRGEVVVQFCHDTTVQGPIELVFEAIQTFYPWTGGPIESKLQVIELSLLPPNSQGIIPAGVHRFPFEFPIPPTLPPTVNIANRLAIYYRLTATLRKSNEGTTFVDWARRSMGKNKLVDVSYLRLVRAIEATPTHALTPSPTSSHSSGSYSDTANDNNTTMTVTPFTDLWSQYNNRLSLDEQHDRLAYSMGGRTTDNFAQPLNTLTKEHGVRYRLSVDRTAIALGTSVGLEVVLQPTQVRTKVRSIYLMIEEKQTFKMKIPGHHSLSNAPAETRKHTETQKMLLKWAYGFPIPPEDEMALDNNAQVNQGPEDLKNTSTTQLGQLYSHDIKHCKTLRQLDQPFVGRQQQLQQQQQREYQQKHSTLLGKNDLVTSSISMLSAMKPSNTTPDLVESSSSSSSSSTTTQAKDKLLNLKLLDHPIELGEYFEGRFVLPVPPCNGILHASIKHDSIKIQHWLRMVVVLEQEDCLFEVILESPMQMLDCRLVADDERQTILPPPPSYDLDDNDRSIQSTVFWEQRQPITTTAQWGTCQRACPCQIRHQCTTPQKKIKAPKTRNSSNTTSIATSKNNNNSNRLSANGTSSLQQPEWGPPPLYSE